MFGFRIDANAAWNVMKAADSNLGGLVQYGTGSWTLYEMSGEDWFQMCESVIGKPPFPAASIVLMWLREYVYHSKTP